MQIATFEVWLGELSVGAAVLVDKERRELVAVPAPLKATEEHAALLGTRLVLWRAQAVLRWWLVRPGPGLVAREACVDAACRGRTTGVRRRSCPATAARGLQREHL